jgi:chorismate mutase
MSVRGIRGATSCDENTPSEIRSATKELLSEIIAKNELTDFGEVVSAIFTTTPDLNAAFPAEAARDLGMNQVPLLCASEIAVPTALPRVIRILLQVNTEKKQSEMIHIYQRAARALRKDISGAQ